MVWRAGVGRGRGRVKVGWVRGWGVGLVDEGRVRVEVG